MSLYEILRFALQNIRGNMLRAVLTLMIIAVGILALVGILTAIDGIEYSLKDNFSSLGANSFNIQRKNADVRANKGGRREKIGDPISYHQAMEFKERFTFPATVCVSFFATNLATAKFGTKETNPNVSLVGVDENYVPVKGLEIEYGRNFSLSEITDGHSKVIIGADLVKSLFNNQPEKALDQIILVSNNRYRVTGVLKSKGASMGNSSDRAVYAPLLNIKSAYATQETDYSLVVAARNPLDLEAAQSEAIGLFRQIRGMRPGEEEDFQTVSSESLVSILRENTTNLRLATIAIGLMTLLGAAIGLMNIMLVSVTERTREIGIYKALGATRRNILIQFLTEAVVICQMGGIVGIILGISIGNIVTLLLGSSFIVPWNWMILGLILCMIVGVVSGIYPAIKASRLDPIEALRYE